MPCKYCKCKNLGGIADCNLSATKSGLQSFLDGYNNVMASIMNAAKVAKDIQTNIENKIDDCLSYFIDKPLAAIMHLNAICKMPAEFAVGISTKVRGYASLMDSIVNTNCDTVGKKSLYEFISNVLTTGAMLSVTFGEFESRQEAIVTASLLRQIKETRDLFTESIEGTIEATIEDSTKAGEQYTSNAESNLAIAELMVATMNYIEEAMLDLPLRRTVILESDRNYIELCAELYGNIDEETLAQFVSDNEIEGDEIFTLQKGREIIYYQEAI